MDFDGTRNLFIEAENLEALKILQKAYAGSVKMIYIDPPYNTGNDSFIYPDKFSESREEYARRVGDKDADGYLKRDGVFQGAWRKNSKDNGHYHSNWLSMMLPRLHLARTLLRDDGVIFISIDDNEQAQLKLLCDEVFGAENFITNFVWNNDGNVDQQSKIKGVHEYVLAYCKNINLLARPTVIDLNIEETSKLFNKIIENSITKNGPANPESTLLLPIGFPATFNNGIIEKRDNKFPKIIDDIHIKNGELIYPARVSSGWSSRNLINLFIKNGCVPISDSEGKETWFALTETGAIYSYKARSDNQGHVLSVIRNLGTTTQNSGMLSRWGLKFSFPKPILLVQYLISIFTNESEKHLILDFFSGSGTTAHAVMQLNAEDGGSRRYICVQLPEETDEKSEARKAGFETIAEIAKKRIHEAGKQISKSLKNGQSVDTGFKVFKLAESNFKPWKPLTRNETEDWIEKSAEEHIDNIADSATPDNIVYELMLRLGCKLTSAVEHKNSVYWVTEEDTDKRIALLLEPIDQTMIDEVIVAAPAKVVALDKLFNSNDALKTNADLQMKDANIMFECV